MEEIKIFKSEQFGVIRTAGTSDEPLFCLVDVARALEYSNPAKAVIDHCKGGYYFGNPHSKSIRCNGYAKNQVWKRE